MLADYRVDTTDICVNATVSLLIKPTDINPLSKFYFYYCVSQLKCILIMHCKGLLLVIQTYKK